MADPEERFDTIVRKLRENSHKMTPQRLAIIRILVEGENHPGAEDIFERLKETFPFISLATVYRNILLIKSLGEAMEIGFPDGSNRYDGNRPYPHPHVICTECRKIRDLDLKHLNEVQAAVVRETDFEILHHRMDFFGICSDCQKKRNETDLLTAENPGGGRP